MLVVTAALSVSEQIKDVGSYAGLASILGLAVLSLLYFGQARELRRLRDWAGRAPERTAELQEQANAAAAAAAQRRVVAQPTSAAAPATRSPAQTPATAAGAAKPAVAGAAGTAATPAPAVPGQPAPNGAPGGQETQAIPAVVPGGPNAPKVPAASTPLPPATPSIAASVPIGPEAPPTDDNPVPLRQVSAAGAVPRARRTPPEVWPPEDQDRGDGADRRRLFGILGAVAAGLVVVVLLVVVFSGGGDDTPKPEAGKTPTTRSNELVPTPSTPSTGTTAAPPITPGDYSIFVLNGTTQNGIAAEFTKDLEADGYRSAGTGTATDQTVQDTEVYYVQGKKRAATAVAKELGVKTSLVKAADPAISVQVQGSGADVVVQIGFDKVPGAGTGTTAP